MASTGLPNFLEILDLGNLGILVFSIWESEIVHGKKESKKEKEEEIMRNIVLREDSCVTTKNCRDCCIG